MTATIADIAERADVGLATIYRSYPTKDGLLADVAIQWLRDWSDLATGRLDASDPVEAFRCLTFDLFEQLRRDRLAIDLLRAAPINDEVELARSDVQKSVAAVMDRSREHGGLRADVGYDEMAVLVLGTAGRLSDTGVMDAVTWRRMAELVLAAIERR